MTYTQSSVAVALTISIWSFGVLIVAVAELWLIFTGQPTLSDRVWAGNNLLGLAIVGWFLWEPLFLAGHFWLGWFRPVGV